MADASAAPKAYIATDGDRLRFIGSATLDCIPALWSQVEELGQDEPLTTIDISQLEAIDTAGAWLIKYVTHRYGASISGASSMAQSLIESVSLSEELASEKPIKPYIKLAAEVGESVARTGRESLGMLSFVGAMVVAFFDILRGRQRVRWHSLATSVRTIGLDALFIVGLMCFVLGIVIAQQSAVQFRSLGLESFAVVLVGAVSFRELGVLMTAIMVAGRSGSSFAAQIGTMNLTEEVDAMRILGISPMNIIVVPRILAVAIAMPLLSFFASITFLVGGGLLCWAYLGISPAEYVDSIRNIVPLRDVWIMLIKAPVFGILIGIIGCYEGMQVRQNTEEVGARTTAAVVAAIFLIIVLDAFFAIFFSAIGW